MITRQLQLSSTWIGKQTCPHQSSASATACESRRSPWQPRFCPPFPISPFPISYFPIPGFSTTAITDVHNIIESRGNCYNMASKCEVLSGAFRFCSLEFTWYPQIILGRDCNGCVRTSNIHSRCCPGRD